MSLTEKLQSIKTNLTSLLTYANGVTGQNDADLGDAIMTLANGFGGGGELSSLFEKIIVEDIVIEEICYNSTLIINHNLGDIPDVIVIARKDTSIETYDDVGFMYIHRSFFNLPIGKCETFNITFYIGANSKTIYSVSTNSVFSDVTSNSFSIKAHTSSYRIAEGDYRLITAKIKSI